MAPCTNRLTTTAHATAAQATEVELLPLPAEDYVDDKGLWEKRYGPYSPEQMEDYARANVAYHTAALQAEYDRLARYYKNGIDCFASPCEKHSGEKTPPFAEFFEKYGGQCLICVVDNNEALQAKNKRLAEALRWYAEQAAGCRKLGRDGDAARAALDADGGGRARAALEQES